MFIVITTINMDKLISAITLSIGKIVMKISKKHTYNLYIMTYDH